MLFSKANLAVRDVATKDKVNRMANAVHFAEDGSTIATDGRSLLAVGPVDDSEVRYPNVGSILGPCRGGVTVPLEIVNQVAKNIPTDKKSPLQYAALTRCDSEVANGKVEFITMDEKKEQRVTGSIINDTFPRWKKTVRGVKDAATVGRVCVNRKTLLKLLLAMDRACPDDAKESPVFISFGEEDDGIMLRAVNHVTGQHAVGVMMPLDMGGEWMKSDKWERNTFSNGAKKKLARTRRGV